MSGQFKSNLEKVTCLMFVQLHSECAICYISYWAKSPLVLREYQ